MEKLLHETVDVGAARPFRALLAADNHLCRIGEIEATADPVLADQTARRSARFAAAEESFAGLRALLAEPERADDPLFHAGDLADFATDANFAAAAAFWNENARRPLLAAPGNHEYCRLLGDELSSGADIAARAARIAGNWPNLVDFATLEHGDVLFVAMDDAFHRVTETQRRAFRREAARGLPLVLLVHAPFWTPELGAVMLERTGGHALYCVGAPDEIVKNYHEPYRTAQRADAPTRDFLEDLRATPNLRAVLAGHVHVFHRSDLLPGVPQICAAPGFVGQAVELEFC